MSTDFACPCSHENTTQNSPAKVTGKQLIAEIKENE